MKNRLRKFSPFIIISLVSFLFGTAVTLSLSENPITQPVVNKAQKIIGFQFSAAEQDSMLGDLNYRLKQYNHLRGYHLENSVPPAISFNPIPVGFELKAEKKTAVFSDYSKTKLPENKDELAFYSIGELAQLIKSRQITSVELTKFFLDRLKKYNPYLHCVITFTEDRAMKDAKKADNEIADGNYKGLLHGIPFGVKDLLATKDYKTTWGAGPYKNQMINEDAAVIKKLEDAGAVLVAKLSMGALAWGDIWFGGMTRNPWNIKEGSSGSSAGPGSAVSAGLIPFAIGTETWGSIVSPSTVCGITGLRPTYGRVSRSGAMALSWSMDKIGPMCRNVEDCAIVFNSIYGPDEKDQTLFNSPFNYNPKVNIKGLKIGYLKKDFGSDYDFKTNDSLTIVKLKEMGADLIPIELPDEYVNDLSFILDAECSAAFEDLIISNRDDLLTRQIKNAWPNVFRASRFIPAADYVNANRVRYMIIQKMAALMKKIDLYLAPSDAGDNSLLTNLTGHPLVVVPNGFIDGMPTSITFVGNLFDEAKILAVAKAYQDATDFHLSHPALNF